jgi:Na+-driven multidrug efflux pump
VAGFGVATRVERFALLVVVALSTVLGPFVGQNWGAKKYERVMSGTTYSQQFSIGWGLVMFILLAILGKTIASVFNANPFVISTVATYFWIVPIGYGAWGVLRLSTIVLSVLNKPLQSALLMLMQAFLLYIPFAYLGSRMFGLKGIFSAAAVSYIIVAFVAYIWLKNFLRADQRLYLSQQLKAEVF